MGHLYFGDNLEVLRESIQDESVDLVYLDPPFNSKRDYNVLFKTPKGHTSDASITAFEDSWHWGPQAEREFDEILDQANTEVAEMIQALRRFLGKNDIMAYLTMMCCRLLEMHRVLKPTGSLYMHCDPTASHYLKIILDGVFGKENFKNEIIWRRTRGHNDKKLTKYGSNHDVLFFYAKSNSWTFNRSHHKKDINVPKTHDLYTHSDGKLYRKDNCLAPGGRGPRYIWNGHEHTWRFTEENAKLLEEQGLIVYSKTGMPRLLRPVDPSQGHPLQDTWSDIDAPNSGSGEKLGYPTQKPLALLQRVIEVSTNFGDVVLDPFCGCGTAIHAAEKLGRKWVGIDITHLAIAVIEERLRQHFPGIQFQTHGTPRDLEGARELARRDKYEFQYWVCHLVGALPYQNKKKGADGGIDGIIYFKDIGNHHKKVIVSVKGGENLSVSMIRDLGHVVSREKAEIGLCITLSNPTRPMREEAAMMGFYAPPFIGAKFPKLQILTVEGILNGTEQPLYPALERGGVQVRRSKGQAAKQLPLLLPYEGKKLDEPAVTEIALTAPPVHKARNSKFKEVVG